MKRNEKCEIVKDLSSLYIDNILSETSKQFVLEHLKECKECEKYYNNLSSEFLNNSEQEKNADNIEIDHLKKVNRKFTTMKWILTSIIVLILLIISYFFIKTCYIDKINSITIDKIINMQKESNNYKLTKTTVETNELTKEKKICEVEHYYKDGKHKEVISHYEDGKLVIDSILYIEDNKYEKVTVFPSLKQIDYQKQDFIQERKGDSLKGIIADVMLNDAGIHQLGVKIRTETYDNKECYVVYDSYNGSYRENYLDKSTGDLIRVVSGTDTYYTEEKYTLIKDIVTNEDIDNKILEKDEYKDYKLNELNYELPEIMKQFYK